MAKIALLTKSLGFGGIEKVVSDLSIILSKQGHDVFLFLMDDCKPVYEFKGKIEIIGTKWWQQFYILLRLKRKYKIDCTISSFEYFNVVNIFTGHGKIISMFHNYRFQEEISGKIKDKFLEWLFARLAWYNSAIICVSHKVAEKAAVRYPKTNIKTIYNNIDTALIQRRITENTIPEELNSFYNDKTFIHVGRFCSQKNQVRLLEAFALFMEKEPNARLVIIGDGPGGNNPGGNNNFNKERNQLETLAMALGIKDSVRFIGFQSNPFAYIARAKAFVLSSDYEGFGIVLIEALACGIPVVSTDCYAGPREIIAPDNKNGVLNEGFECTKYGILSALDARSLASAMSEVLENELYSVSTETSSTPELRRNSEVFRQRAEVFSHTCAAKAWAELLEGILKS